jgi:hypothetical protein
MFGTSFGLELIPVYVTSCMLWRATDFLGIDIQKKTGTQQMLNQKKTLSYSIQNFPSLLSANIRFWIYSISLRTYSKFLMKIKM